MQASLDAEAGGFWELLNAALRLQHSATRLAVSGELEQAAECERRAIAVLLEATCCLEPDAPALITVRQLAAAGLSRLRKLNRQSRPGVGRARRKRLLAQ